MWGRITIVFCTIFFEACCFLNNAYAVERKQIEYISKCQDSNKKICDIVIDLWLKTSNNNEFISKMKNNNGFICQYRENINEQFEYIKFECYNKKLKYFTGAYTIVFQYASDDAFGNFGKKNLSGYARLSVVNYLFPYFNCAEIKRNSSRINQGWTLIND